MERGTQSPSRENRRIYHEEECLLTFDEPRRRQLVRWLKPLSITRALDVGCLSGDFLELLPATVERWGVDFLRHPQLEEGIHFIEADLSRGLPFPNGFFDLVFAGEIIEHLLDTDFFLSECHRVLQDRGILILTTPNLSCWLSGWRWLTYGQPWCVDYRAGQSGHVRYFSPKALQEMLTAHGFGEIQFASAGGLEFLQRLWIFYRLAHALFPLRGKSLMAMGKKVTE
ncbi:MAG: class I SAM-dependent methyltransferase [Candidatus Methylomirabilales bacterium]